MNYQQIQLIILATLGIMGILLIFLLLKMNHLKKQLDSMQRNVKKYVTYIMDDEPVENHRVSRYAPLDRRKDKLKDDEERNELIQNVLKEIFP